MFNRFWKKEKRETLEEVLIRGGALLGSITKEQAMNIPSVSACVNLIADTIASLPIHLYKETDSKVEVIDDERTRLLNEDTGDMLDGWQFKRAMVEDYLLSGSGYAFIKRRRNQVRSLHYVENNYISVMKNTDPIEKRADIHVSGMPYREWEFIKLLRKSKDGSTGKGIIKENNQLLSVAYNTIVYEELLVKTGGNKKGFLLSETRLTKEAIEELKLAWNNLYKNNTDNVVVLNNGLDFKEASQTSVELQLNEHKNTNSEEICKLFLVPVRILKGEASPEEYNNWIKICIMPILTAFECALNKDLLLPSEKKSFYFAFDTAELIKGNIEQRFSAYEIGVKSGILQIDEVRYRENLPPLGLNFIKLGLQDVLYNPETKEIYTPNTNKATNIENPDQSLGEPQKLENNKQKVEA
jgi:HK97 family phage portal protein